MLFKIVVLAINYKSEYFSSIRYCINIEESTSMVKRFLIRAPLNKLRIVSEIIK